jgi:hypothetical protein
MDLQDKLHNNLCRSVTFELLLKKTVSFFHFIVEMFLLPYQEVKLYGL